MTVVRFENVSKTYDLYAGRRSIISTLRFTETVDSPSELFHALSKVSFEVRKGETIGIVGRNGSGKSTILKIIAGITKATSGSVSINGRISSLIELGAGFHPDLTGGENVYMNAAMLGLSRKYIDAKFKEILDFAELWDFVDVPVKKYSSGMYARLGFAVASVVDPDIFIVDEVLAVGDEGFQRKCYAKIEDLRKNGVSIILVSHSASAVIELCSRGILVDGGEIILDGQPKFVISKYHQLLFSRAETRIKLRDSLKRLQLTGDAAVTDMQSDPLREKDREEELNIQESFDESLLPKTKFSYADNSYRGVRIQDPKIVTAGGKKVNNLVLGRRYSYVYDVIFDVRAYHVRFGMLIKSITGFAIGGGVTSQPDEAIPFVERGSIAQLRFDFKCLLRPAGVYFMNAGVVGVVDGSEVFLDRIIDAYAFRVQPERDLIGGGVVSLEVESSCSVVGSD